jgi:hypothetical protein
VAVRRLSSHVFPGCPRLEDGYYWANDKPGLGIDLDEKLAARFPINDDPSFDMSWGNLRRKDGIIYRFEGHRRFRGLPKSAAWRRPSGE